MEEVDFDSSVVFRFKKRTLYVRTGVFRRAHRSPIQNGVVSKWTLQPTRPPTHHCLGGVTGPSLFFHPPSHPPSRNIWTFSSLHEGHRVGLVDELLGGPWKHGASMEATLLRWRPPVYPRIMSGKPFVDVQVAAAQRALLVARREVAQGVMLKCEGGIYNCH